MTDAPHLPAAVLRTVCLCAVFDDLESVLVGKGEDRVHVAGHTGKMHADDCAGLVGELRLYRGRRDVLRFPVDIREYRRCADGHDAGR
jgi:hypothetical protein